MWYLDYGGANNITNQRPPLSVCTVNTISLSRPPDSAALLQLCGGDGTKGNGSRVRREVRVCVGDFGYFEHRGSAGRVEH